MKSIQWSFENVWIVERNLRRSSNFKAIESSTQKMYKAWDSIENDESALNYGINPEQKEEENKNTVKVQNN